MCCQQRAQGHGSRQCLSWMGGCLQTPKFVEYIPFQARCGCFDKPREHSSLDMGQHATVFRLAGVEYVHYHVPRVQHLEEQ
jgi:hypothetical protein